MLADTLPILHLIHLTYLIWAAIAPLLPNLSSTVDAKRPNSSSPPPTTIAPLPCRPAAVLCTEHLPTRQCDRFLPWGYPALTTPLSEQISLPLIFLDTHVKLLEERVLPRKSARINANHCLIGKA